MPAMAIIHIGDTLINDMSRQLTIGIQKLYLFMLAVFAILKHGDAIRATTAGRAPQKNLSTYMISLNDRKNIAISSMAIIDGIAMPKAPTTHPQTPLNL